MFRVIETLHAHMSIGRHLGDTVSGIDYFRT